MPVRFFPSFAFDALRELLANRASRRRYASASAVPAGKSLTMMGSFALDPSAASFSDR